ncbi:MAG TPA: XRE family transcriptional regulator [Polyangiaceae bacterium]|nr:XRE family transcriptional regulator [Polyangiaceae bacterium]
MPRRTDPNPLAQAIGLRIKQLRAEQGVTAEKLAYESEVGSKGFMSDIEHGLALPSLTTLERIAQRLDVSLFDLLVLPSRSNREQLVEWTRSMPQGALVKLLRELSDARQPAPTHIAQKLVPIRGYPSLEVAAGWAQEAAELGEPTAQLVRLPGKFDAKRDFAVRASGSSMQGFRSTIHDGDWLVMRMAERAPGAAVGQVVLVLREDEYGDKSLHLKRVSESGRRLWFRSDEASVKPVAVTEGDRILATLQTVLAPTLLAPVPRTRFTRKQFSAVFGLKQEPTSGWSRIEGHLFFVVERSAIGARGRLSVECKPRPAETAFVLVNDGEILEYVGLAHYDVARGGWRVREPSRASRTSR